MENYGGGQQHKGASARELLHRALERMSKWNALGYARENKDVKYFMTETLNNEGKLWGRDFVLVHTVQVGTQRDILFHCSGTYDDSDMSYDSIEKFKNETIEKILEEILSAGISNAMDRVMRIRHLEEERNRSEKDKVDRLALLRKAGYDMANSTNKSENEIESNDKGNDERPAVNTETASWDEAATRDSLQPQPRHNEDDKRNEPEGSR